MELKLDRDKCCGFGECIALAPELFQMGGDNRVVVIGELTGENGQKARSAAWACPAEAIELAE